MNRFDKLHKIIIKAPVFMVFLMRTVLRVVLIFFILEFVFRLSWSIREELHYGYFRKYYWNHDYRFKPGKFAAYSSQKASDKIGIDDLLQAIQRPVAKEPSLAELIPPSRLITEADGVIYLNSIIQNEEKRDRFLTTYRSCLNWKDSEIERLLGKPQNLDESKKLTRLMMEAMYPVYEQFSTSLYIDKNPLNKLFYGRQAAINFLPPTLLPMEKKFNRHELLMLAVGGSTTRCSKVNQNQCWSSYLEEKLHRFHEEHPQFPFIRIVNLGIPGGTSRDSQQAIAAFLTANHIQQFDFLLWYEGLNDAFYSIQRPPLKDYVRHGRELSGPGDNRREPVGLRLVAYLYSHSALIYLPLEVIKLIFNPEFFRNKTGNGTDISKVANINFQHLQDIQNKVTKNTFMFSIPLPERFSKNRHYLDYHIKKSFYERLKILAGGKGIPFGDVAPVIEAYPPDEVFTRDHIHLNAHGNMVLAAAIYEFIMPYLQKDSRGFSGSGKLDQKLA